jgi:hypothetical protein
VTLGTSIFKIVSEITNPLVFLAISIFDLVNTVFGIQAGYIQEANYVALNLMNYMGLFWFSIYKLSVTFFIIFFLECLWRSKRYLTYATVQIIYVFIICGYVGIFTVGMIVFNLS